MWVQLSDCDWFSGEPITIYIVFIWTNHTQEVQKIDPHVIDHPQNLSNCDWFSAEPITFGGLEPVLNMWLFFWGWRRPTGNVKMRRVFWKSNHNFSNMVGASQRGISKCDGFSGKPITISKKWLAPANREAESITISQKQLAPANPDPTTAKNPLHEETIMMIHDCLGKVYLQLLPQPKP